MNLVRGGISQILIYQIYYNLTHISYSFTKYTNWWLVCLQNCTLITTVNLVTFLSPQKEIPLRLVISNSFIPSSLAQTNPLSISGLHLQSCVSAKALLPAPGGPRSCRTRGFSTHFSGLLSAITYCQSARTWARPNPCAEEPLGPWEGTEPGACRLRFATQSPLTDPERSKLRE